MEIEELPPLVRARLKAEELARRHSRRKIKFLYPEEGALRRDLYPRHMAFFGLGARYDTRAFIAANRVGKTLGCGGYELVLHLTGEYPTWWSGRRFNHPTDWWVAGESKETV